MNRSILRLLGPRRRISLRRVVGPGAWLSVALWSVVALVLFGVYSDPAFLPGLSSANSVGDAAGLVLGVVPVALLPLVVVAVALVVVPLRLVREVRRAFRGGRRGFATNGYSADDVAGGSLLGGGLLGGGLLGGVGGFDAFDGGDGDDGDGGGGDE